MKKKTTAGTVKKPNNRAGNQAAPTKKPNNRLNNLIMALVILLMAAGAGLLLYPTVADFYNSITATRAITTYRREVDNIDYEKYALLLEGAQAYNEKLLTLSAPRTEILADLTEYFDTLNVNSRGMMGYITIDVIDVHLPMYHGAEDGTLSIAVGHLPGTSLPTGGASTHVALTGHTGLPSALLFTGVDRLIEDDYFKISVLKEELWYRVDQILVVLPTETEAIDIIPDQDHVTLVTCTPYGINSHRLLVRGTRCDAPPVEELQSQGMAIDNMTNLAIAFAAGVLVTCGVFGYSALRKAAKKRKILRKQREREARRNNRAETLRSETKGRSSNEKKS